MDPISASLLVAVATGAGGELGHQLWSTLRGMVRRGQVEEAAESSAPAPGEIELASLAEAPHEMERAWALSAALSRRGEQDPPFRASLAQWQQKAQLLRTGDGNTHNAINGGTQNGPVVQGRDFSEINFNSPAGDHQGGGEASGDK